MKNSISSSTTTSSTGWASSRVDLAPAVHAGDKTILFAQTKVAAAKAAGAFAERGVNSAVLNSSMDMSERREVFAAFEDSEHALVAAPRLLDEGVDVPSANLAIVLASSRSKRQMIQRMGRVVRKKVDRRLARLAILYVEGTSEDPTAAHEDFLYVVTGVARGVPFSLSGRTAESGTGRGGDQPRRAPTDTESG